MKRFKTEQLHADIVSHGGLSLKVGLSRTHKGCDGYCQKDTPALYAQYLLSPQIDLEGWWISRSLRVGTYGFRLKAFRDTVSSPSAMSAGVNLNPRALK